MTATPATLKVLSICHHISYIRHLCAILVICLVPCNKCDSMQSRRGKKGLKSSRDKNEGVHCSGEGGEEPAYVVDPGSELRLGTEKKKKREVAKTLDGTITKNKYTAVYASVVMVVTSFGYWRHILDDARHRQRQWRRRKYKNSAKHASPHVCDAHIIPHAPSNALRW